MPKLAQAGNNRDVIARPPRPKGPTRGPGAGRARKEKPTSHPASRRRKRASSQTKAPSRGFHITTARGSISVSWRLVVFLTVIMLIVPSVLFPLTDYLRQREQMRALQAEVAEVKESIANYEREKARWDNEAYIVSQARDRLGWVRPGETPYVVIDAHTVTGENPQGRIDGNVPVNATPPWYLQVVDSLDVAERAEEQPESGKP